MSEELARLNVVMPKELKKKLEEKAKSKGLSLSSYVRMILIEETEKK